ncbi:MAG TPA: hypothetical protein VHG28_09605, partial [Longimicrobiaceae bacterium]|nr:hypothetical protein [Longimicrobiaceae bacterium]
MYRAPPERVNGRERRRMEEDPVRGERRDGPVHALERAGEWREGWRRSGRLVLLLDFDGTLAPIVERPELAEIPPATRA